MEIDTEWMVEGQHREEMQRALTVASAGTVLLQTTINRVITSLVLRFHGVTSTLTHKPGTGNAAYVNRRTASAPSGQWLNDTTEPGVVASTYVQVNFPYASYVSRGKVTRKLQATGRAYANVLADEMMFRVEDHADGLENGYVQGDTGANAQQCNGLLTLINAVAGQVIANTTVDVGDGVALAKLDETIDKVKGSPMDKVIFASQKGTRLIDNALQAQQRFPTKTEVDAGFEVETYQGIPIIKSTQIPDDMDWDASVPSILAFTGEAVEPTTALIVVNKRHVWIEDLTPTSVLPLAKTSSQFDQFDIFTDSCVVFHNTLGGAILAGLNG